MMKRHGIPREHAEKLYAAGHHFQWRGKHNRYERVTMVTN
jgi:hypothetical protein